MTISMMSTSAYLPNAVDFLPANSPVVSKTALTGISNSDSGIVYFRFRLDGNNGNDMTFMRINGTGFEVNRSTANQVRIVGVNPLGTTVLGLFSTTNFTSSTAWHKVLMAWDLSAGLAYLYIDDVADLASSIIVNDVINYTIGATATQVGGASAILDGCLSEVYFAPGQYMDITNATNRAKFNQYLGNDGSIPTGVAPLVYLKNDYLTYGTNSGTGGNFTVTGTLTAASTRPGL